MIEVRRSETGDPLAFEVTVRDGGGETSHHVTMSRATWADAYRSAGHRETADWHFVDTELDSPDLRAACFGYPAPDQPASAGSLATDFIASAVAVGRGEAETAVGSCGSCGDPRGPGACARN